MNTETLFGIPNLAAGVRLHVDRLTDRPVLLFPEGVLELNGSAVSIVRLCDGFHNVDEIVAVISAAYEGSMAVLRTDVSRSLHALMDMQLVTMQAERMR